MFTKLSECFSRQEQTRFFMLFNSFQYLIFFPVVVFLYFLLPHKIRWVHLLLASCYFYMTFIPIYILILFLTIIIDYFAGIFIEKTNGKRKKIFLLLSLISNISILGYFKYVNFIGSNINHLSSLLHFHYSVQAVNIILPIGLSFHTFQAMSYIFEVYRGNQKAEKHFGIYALYVMFFPQLVAGPIERPQNMLHQFYEKKHFDFDRTILGIEQILWGLFKKVVVGDILSVYVNSIYNNYEVTTGFTLVLAASLFVFEIYCDFSGYSDIAIGSARVMGFDLMANFNYPLSSKSISELWRRWHISLSSWVNDYLYNPLALQFRNYGKMGIVLATLISFSILGLWHGASWNFVITGMLSGIYVSYEMLTRKKRKFILKFLPEWLYNTICRLFTFCFFAFSLIFFRSETLHQASVIINHIFTGEHFWNFKVPDTGVFATMSIGFALLLLWEYFYFRRRKKDSLHINWVSSISYSVFFIMVIVLFGVSNGSQFIYFQF
jgi:alginate O-acetyltransferase complex protein AlgI